MPMLSETRPSKVGKWTEPALRVLRERYLTRKDGEVVETPEEMCWRVALSIAAGEARFGRSPAAVREIAEAFYETMIDGSFLPNSPTLMNAGKGNGLQYSACYVLPIGDSMEEIFDSVKAAAIIHKSGGGTGFAFSRLRPKDDLVKSTGGRASGPVSFLRVFNGATEAVKQGGCVTPDTRVSTSRGIVEIRSLGPADAPADTWHTPARPLVVVTDQGLRESDEFYNHGVAPVRRIRTRHGYSICGTLAHRLRVIDEEGRYVWKALEDIKVGDWVTLQKKTYLPVDDFRFPAFNVQPHPNATPVRIPETATEELGEFIGYFLGDGAVSVNARGTGRLILTVCKAEPDVAAHLLKIGEHLFGLRPNPQTKPDDASTNYFFNSTTLVSWLKAIGVEKASALSVRLPEIVFQAGPEFARAVVRGLFTADGTVSREGYPSLCSTSQALIEDVQEILLALGVPSAVAIVTNRKGAFGRNPLYRLHVVTRDGLQTFAKEIGFLSSAKSVRLQVGLEKMFELNDVIPFQGHLLRAIYGGPGRGSGPGRSRRGANRKLYRALQHYLPAVVAPRHLTRSRLKRLAEVHPEIAAHPTIAWFLANNQFYDEVTKIEEGESLTLDLSVPDNHTYVANGFVSHNTRRGANMGILKVDHPDILEFIECKLDGGITNFNISVAATDAFMDALEKGEEYDLVNPHTGKITGRLWAREVFDRIVRAAWRTGDPGMVFLDRINASPANPTPEIGMIEATNPCGEQPLLPNEACNLGSLNVSKFARQSESGEWAIDWDEMERVIRLSVRFLDDVIEMNPYPLPEIDATVKANRRIGLGIMGWADLLFMLGIPYDSDGAVELGSRLMAFVKEKSHDQSTKLAEERGPFPNWSHSIYKHGRPMRNSTVTTIAPTGTISMISGCSSGVEPIFALAFEHRVKQSDGERVLTFVNETFDRIARDRAFHSDALMTEIARRGTLHGIPGVPEDAARVFRTAHDIGFEWHVRHQAAFQRSTDNGVSKTINLPNDASEADVARAYQLAWELGCLGITVFRDGCKGEQVLNIGVGAKKDKAEGVVVPTAQAVIKPRPHSLTGATYRVGTPIGTAFITVNQTPEGEPFEVFLQVGKGGSDTMAVAEALGRLISLVLRMPSPLTAQRRLEEVISQLSRIGGAQPMGFGASKILSLPDAIARTLAEHIGQVKSPAEAAQLPVAGKKAVGDLCKECGQATFIYEEGCKKCLSCGFNEC
jgi:ribonucleoside-diphosphate reductase alpha chain